MNALENVSLPLLLQGTSPAVATARARELLQLVGLTERASHFVHQLSGGEQQRTAIARALAHRPTLLVADEPTGNLDSASAARVLALLQEIAREQLTTLILVTHSNEVAAAASRQIELRDGRVVSDRALAAA
jgi:putative ABC transport system ATP-binding protein